MKSIGRIWLFFACIIIETITQTYPNDPGCDPRCASSNCNVLFDYQSCVSGCQPYPGTTPNYQWVGTTTCASYCPAGQYHDLTAPTNYSCYTCNSNCSTCNGGSNTQCLSCAATAYQKNTTSCYNLPNHSYGYNPCPDPYYALQITMKCLACPTGCASCNIFLSQFMPGTYSTDYNMANTNCSVDPLCGYTLKCHSCNVGYFLQSGMCYTNVCRKYQLYNATSGSFNPSYCYCMSNYFMSGVTCSACDFTCTTCGPASTTCLTCPDGATLSTGSCTYNSTIQIVMVWNTDISIGSGWTSNYPQTSTCGSYQWIFGSYWGYNIASMTNLFPAAVLTIASSAFSNGQHYAIKFRARFLFIDQWPNSMSLIFRQGGQDRYAYNFVLGTLIGEYLCGLNYDDYIDIIQFNFPHTSANLNLLIQASQTGYAWGVRDIQIMQMACDSTCNTCSGPSATECLGCYSALHQVLVNGDCVCDTANGYYKNLDLTCQQTCDAGYYLNPVTRQCENTCVFPFQFLLLNPNTGLQECTENCPTDYYKRWSDYTCTTSCFDPAQTDITQNFFRYNGSDRSCYNICPVGMYGDPQSQFCVSVCPSTATVTPYQTYGYFSQGHFCYTSCSSSNYAFPGTRQCLSSCPAGYYSNTKDVGNGVQKLCEEVCSVTLGGSKLYGDNSTMTCVNTCPLNTYADQATNLCLRICNSTSYRQNLTIASVITGTCQLYCDVTASPDNLFGDNFTHNCVKASLCQNGTYGDRHSTYCQSYCTVSGNYADNSTKTCQTTCTSGFRQNHTRMCVATCPSQNNLLQSQYGDTVGRYCVPACTGSYYSDNQTNRECVQKCAATPAATFGLNNQCVYNCSSTTWADPFSTYRICTTSCTNNAVNKSYGYNDTRICVLTCPDTYFGQIIGGIPLCVYVCQNGWFGNPNTNLCVQYCPQPYYGDPTGNRTCVLDCQTEGYFSLNASVAQPDGTALLNRTCTQVCTFGWADNYTRTCAITPFGCTQNLYAHQNNHKCVENTECNGFGDPVTRTCVNLPSTQCYLSSSVRYFGDDSTKMCVLVCPQSPDYFGDNSTKQCKLACSNNELKDFQNDRRCVTANNCSRQPIVLFGDQAAGTCVTALNCTSGTYGDNNTFLCESDCTGPNDLLYADPVSKQCVDVCELGYYALNISVDVGVCSQRCPVPQWGDNLTVQCTQRCSINTYGVNYTDPITSQYFGVCQTECPFNQFARDADNLCVQICGPDLWGQTVSRKCLTSPFQCPTGYYADNTTHMCVVPTGCSVNGGIPYVADNQTKQCVSGCPINITNWADLDKKLCVQVCPYNKFGDNSSLQCLNDCQGTNQYADPQLRVCVQVCSEYPIPMFGYSSTNANGDIIYLCVEARYCPPDTWAQTVYNRLCVSRCPDPRVDSNYPQTFSDNITRTCVIQCPTYYYGNIVFESNYATCESICPPFANGTLKFADNYTKTCVKVCPSSQGTFGDQVALRCVLVCPLSYYAQLTSSVFPDRYCVQTCDTGTWSQQVLRTCVLSPFDCPTINASHYYAYDAQTKCVQTCPQSDNLWGENSTYKCQGTCTTGFKYNITRVCIDICPQSLDDDGSFSDQGMCYVNCITPNYYRDPQNARSCQSTCSFLPDKYYADSTTMKCVLYCPTYPQFYFAYDNDKKCELTCPGTTMKDQSTMKCVSTCPNNTFFDPNSDQCVQKCPIDYNLTIDNVWFGDSTPTIATCVIATNCPSTYYADINVQLCVKNCSQNQWKYGKNCVRYCPAGYYGNQNTGFCVQPSGCPSNKYASNVTLTCVAVCVGSYADQTNQVCVDICPTNYYADPATRKCSLSCTNNASISLHKNLANQTCISSCPTGSYLNTVNNNCQGSCSDPYYADNTTNICVSVCPSSPPLYGQNDTNQCLLQCSNLTNEFKFQPDRVCVTSCPADYYRNNITRFCVKQCFNNTFADLTSKYCVSNCTPKYSLLDPNVCSATCPGPYYRDPTTFQCVTQCPTYPQQYFKVVTTNDRYCSLNCPTNQFRDRFSYSCVSTCPPSPPTYADTTSGNCTTICPNGYYIDVITRTCKDKCTGLMVADPVSGKCVNTCTSGTNGTDYYADYLLSIPKCVQYCSPNTFADPYTQKCKSTCGSSPMTYGFDGFDQVKNKNVRICLTSCPYPYVADNSTHQCEQKCDNALYPYLDKAVKSCVKKCTSQIYKFSYMPNGNTVDGECVQFCPNGTFALLTNNSCVIKCPNGLYGQTDNNTCYANCTLANGKYADPQVNLCVQTCTYNDSFDSFADLYSRTCVTQCPVQYFTFADTHSRRCEPRCTLTTQYADPTTGYCQTTCSTTPVLLFADPQTLSCVQNCSLYSQRYINLVDQNCVLSCSQAGTFMYADDSTRTCVSADGCPDGFYGDNQTNTCVQVCPTDNNLYGDPVSKTCVSTCQTNYFADFTTRLCVRTCPSVPALFSQNTTQTCIPSCPNNSYADNHTRRCIAVCSIIPYQTFADNTTNLCVKTCPTEPDYFASNKTFECVFKCPTTPKMYADYSTRTCVLYCPNNTHISTFADEPSRICVQVCLGSTFMQNSTHKCVSVCLTGYADPISKYCMAICPPNSYGYNGTSGTNKTCVTTCPTVSPALYAEDGNNMCMTDCLAIYGTYRDPSTKRCVKICPVSLNYYAQNTTRMCYGVGQCPLSTSTYTDFSTRFCVQKCPSIPSLYAILTLGICSPNCLNNTWAENFSRTCIDQCPSTPIDTYGDNSTWTCVAICPTKPMTYASDFTRTCVTTCPDSPDYYADNATQSCVLNCANGTFADSTTRKCVTTCPNNWYAQNSTGRCVSTCADHQFADILLHICVQKCSVDPIYYGNPDTHICVIQCPSVNNSYGNILTQQCVNDQANGTSKCPPPHFADDLTRLCVQVCPMKNNKFGDNSTRKCVSRCPAGTQNTFSDNSTMRCVKTCPQYPDLYAQEYSRKCVSLCLEANISYSGSFADNSSRLCVQKCPSDPDYYSDNSTRRCVFVCPSEPLTFADNQTRRCVARCPSTPDIYGDMSTLRCVPDCPFDQWTFADPSTRLCVKICPSSHSLFGDIAERRCVGTCPNGTYSDNSSRLCVSICPQYPDTYGDYYNHKCVSICPIHPDIYADPTTRQCVLRCPDGFYAQNDTRRCVPECPYALVSYADNLTNRCVKKCPSSQATYGDNSTNECVKQCPQIPFTYADNLTQMCLSICTNITDVVNNKYGGYADNASRVCVKVCPNLSYGDITTRYCVAYCPQGWYAYDLTNMCVLDCPSPYYADPTTLKCVQVCPKSQILFGQPFNRTCSLACPETTYADFQSQTCVSICPHYNLTNNGSYDTFAYQPDNTCVDQCPIPLYGYPVTYICLDVCPNPYYQNVTDHRCYKCPASCASCNYPQACLTCVTGNYLYSGACVQSCPTFPTITYANPNGECGTSFQCTPGYFALNITKTCVQTCPFGFFKNNSQQTCDSCQRGCSTCTNSTYCIICNTTLAIWYQFSCFTFCSPLRKYYATTGCVTTCPIGTFLNLTTCQSCSAICKSCIVQSQNCITCADGLYLSNNLCVQSCPTNFKPVNQNNSLVCLSCSDPGVNCAVQPLTYEVTQFVDNFKYTFMLKFSEPVNILGNLADIIAIQQVTNSRLLATTYSNLDYTIIDYGGGVYAFVLNNVNALGGSNAQYQFQILDPSAIVSPSGQLPTTTRTTVVIDATSIYSLSDFNKSFTSYFTFIIWMSMILLIFSFWTLNSVWAPIFDFFQLMFAVFLVNVDLPPTAMYALGIFNLSAFTFLPNFFANSLPPYIFTQGIMNSSAYSILGDFSFLRTMGQLYFILLVVGILLFGAFVMSKKFFWKPLKKWSKPFIRENFWKKHLYNIIHILFLPTFLIGFLNFRDYSVKSSIIGFSIFSSYIFMIMFIVVIVYILYKLKKTATDNPITYLMLQKAYNFITLQKIVLLDNDIHHFIYQKNEVDLKHANYPKINDLLIMPFTIQTRMGPMQMTAPLINILHKFIVAIFITICYDNSIVQSLFFIIINIVYALYIILKRPYIKIGTKILTNEIIIHNMIVVSIILLILLIFKVQVNTLLMSDKLLIANVICIVILEGVTVNFIYFVYRIYGHYFQNFWKKFVNSELFKINYTVQHLELSKKYEENEKLLLKQTRPRDQFLMAIKVQQGEALAGMVLRDPNHTKGKDKFKQINLRPNKTQIVQKDITQMFKSIHNDHQKSNKSVRSSQRLSKGQRNKVRNEIFEKFQQKKQDAYQPVKMPIQEAGQEQQKSQSEASDEYQFQYLQEQYPQGTPMQQILKGVKKGEVILP